NAVRLDFHLLKPISNADTCAPANQQCDEQADGRSSCLHGMFFPLPHRLMNRPFLLIAVCKFQYVCAILEYVPRLLFRELEVFRLDTLDPFITSFSLCVIYDDTNDLIICFTY